MIVGSTLIDTHTGYIRYSLLIKILRFIPCISTKDGVPLSLIVHEGILSVRDSSHLRSPAYSKGLMGKSRALVIKL